MVSRLKTGLVALVAALVLAGVPAAWACKSAGQFKHVGVVTAVDVKALTLTIKDAETGEPITFAATAKQLKERQAGRSGDGGVCREGRHADRRPNPFVGACP